MSNDEHNGGAGETLGRYRLIERLGAGAMGDVYRARDDSLGREVAIKVVRTAARTDYQREMFRKRFDNEARALAALSHPNVVNVFDVGVEDDTPYLVMELAEGRSLADRIAQIGPLAPAEVCALGAQIAAALDAAHARGIVHRDVKPGNVLEAGDGVWKLADFGVAHVPDSSLTLTGQFVGSPAYAAPEALGRGELGPPADVFGLGVTLYEALTGARPYGPDGVLSAGALAAATAPQSIGARCQGLAPGAAAAIDGAIERDPARRITARQVADGLSGRAFVPAAVAIAVPAPPARPRRNWTTWAIAAGLLIGGIGVGAALSSNGSSADRPVPAAGGRDSSGPLLPPAPPRRELSHKDVEKIEKEWRQVGKKIEQGKPYDALKHLDKILERDPSDERAQALYYDIAGEAWQGGYDD